VTPIVTRITPPGDSPRTEISGAALIARLASRITLSRRRGSGGAPGSFARIARHPNTWRQRIARVRFPPLAPLLGQFSDRLASLLSSWLHPASTERSRIFFARSLAREVCAAAVGIAAGVNQWSVRVFVVFAEREGSVATADYCCVARLGMDRPSGCATAQFGSMSICGSAVRRGDCPLASLVSEQLAGFFHAL
jgi:hypothetical protein